MKHSITLVFVLCFVFITYSCDVCGASNNILSPGNHDKGNVHAFGIQYQFRCYHSTTPEVYNQHSQESQESYQRFDVRGQLRIGNHWQLQTIVPFVHNSQKNGDEKVAYSGIGDPQLMAVYYLINRSDSSSNELRITIGAGIKCPLGNYTSPSNHHYMLYSGTGTWDLPLRSTIFFKKESWSAIGEISGMLRGKNSDNYEPGQVFNVAAFCVKNYNALGLIAGLQYAWNGMERMQDIVISGSPSQGNIVTLGMGTTIQRNQWNIQAVYHIPVYQQLSSGNTNQKQAFNLSIHYFFKS